MATVCCTLQDFVPGKSLREPEALWKGLRYSPSLMHVHRVKRHRQQHGTVPGILRSVGNFLATNEPPTLGRPTQALQWLHTPPCTVSRMVENGQLNAWTESNRKAKVYAIRRRNASLHPEAAKDA